MTSLVIFSPITHNFINSVQFQIDIILGLYVKAFAFNLSKTG